MKDKIIRVDFEISKENGALGTLWFRREKQGWSSWHDITPSRKARALEAQRLFLAQLERKYKEL